MLILIPLMPLAPIVVTSWLPWERWIPWGDLPKMLLGPYLLYVAFAAWYFEWNWSAAMAALCGAVLSVMAIAEKIKKRRASPLSGSQSVNTP
jgi:hypothetical protein